MLEAYRVPLVLAVALSILTSTLFDIHAMPGSSLTTADARQAGSTPSSRMAAMRDRLSQGSGSCTQAQQRWSGYVLSPASVTYSEISGSWTVPHLHYSPGVVTATSQWVGIDGANTNILIQAGTEEAYVPVLGTYEQFAWWEIIPPPPGLQNENQPIASVAAGDRITAEIHRIRSSNRWSISVNDNKWKKKFSEDVTYPTTNGVVGRTAEWVVEWPSRPIQVPFTTLTFDITGPAAFDPVAFHDLTVNSKNPSLTTSSRLLMCNNGQVLATPSDPKGGNSFTVDYGSSPTGSPSTGKLPHATGTVLYRADWSQGPDGWTNLPGFPSQPWTASNGVLSGSYFAVIPPFNPGQLGISDYAVQAEIRVTASPWNFKIFARQPSDQMGYTEALVDTDSGSQVRCESVLNSNQGTFNPGQDWHTYRIELKGANVRGLIDGQPECMGSDSRFSSGGLVGIATFNGIEVRSFEVVKL